MKENESTDHDTSLIFKCPMCGAAVSTARDAGGIVCPACNFAFERPTTPALRSAPSPGRSKPRETNKRPRRMLNSLLVVDCVLTGLILLVLQLPREHPLGAAVDSGVNGLVLLGGFMHSAAKPDAPRPVVVPALIFFALFLLYFLPALVAENRRHRNQAPIGIVNFFLGWTFLGWVIALAWAYSANREEEPA